MIELRETEIDALIRSRLLTPDMRKEMKVVRAALYLHLDRTLGSMR
jgi:hypothetical protein